MADWQLHILGAAPDDDGNVVQDLETRMRDFIVAPDERLKVTGALLTMDSGLVLTLVPGRGTPRFVETDENLRPVT